MLAGKKILIGITGSIAAYKAILLIRLLIKSGAEVKVVLTPSAKDFVSPLVLSTLSKNKVYSDLFTEDTWANHVMLGRWADLFIIAPASCNTIAKMANGACDNVLLAVYLSAVCPVMVAPAMDEDMWKHPATKRNLETLRSFGHTIIDVEKGELASGLSGEGRLAEPEDILLQIKHQLAKDNALAGKKILVTAGPTYEAIDPVRFIGNHSSGKMGFALAEAFNTRGAEVVLVTGPNALPKPSPSIRVIPLTSAEEMYNICMDLFAQTDIAVLSAAVADYRPARPEPEKIKKKDGELVLNLVKTKDILKSLGLKKKENQFLAGFALETNNEKQNALIKLKDKNADMIILNSMRDKNATFGFDTNKITIFDAQGNETNFDLASKQQIADSIVNSIIQKINDQA